MKRRTFIISSALALTAPGFTMYCWKNRWKYIVVHHSAGTFGNIEFLQKVHRTRQAHDPVDAIPYHYIIGNGKGMKMGEIASDWRRTYDIWGMHVSANNVDHNFRGIGICLIGNFEQHNVPKAQYQSLVRLTKYLSAKYEISPKNVNAHGLIKGEATKCPGKNFPMKQFLLDIA